jgi:NTP pyrophosphatase (non-canonical NTP hydrolase)
MDGGGLGPLKVAEFERNARDTDKLGQELETAVLGLFGEIGTLVSALKKKRRDADAYFGYRAVVLEEMGDVLWYASAVARRGGTSLIEAADRVATGQFGSEEVRLGDIEPGDAGHGDEILSDIPRIPGLLDAIFRLIEARSNEIRSQPTR